MNKTLILHLKKKPIVRYLYHLIRLLLLPRTDTNRINIIKTIYYNFRCLPIKQALKLPIWIFYGFKIGKMGKMVLEEVDDFNLLGGMLQLGRFTSSTRDYKGVFVNYGVIKIKGFLRIDAGVKINNYGDILFNRNLLGGSSYVHVNSSTKLQMGAFTRTAAGVTIRTGNGHYIIDTITGKVNNNRSDIIIGDYCWLAMNSFFSKGTILPDRTIVAASSVVNKDFSDLPDNSIIAGNPAQLVAQNKVRIFNYEEELMLNNYFTKNDDKNKVIDLTKTNIQDIISYKPDKFRIETKWY